MPTIAIWDSSSSILNDSFTPATVKLAEPDAGTRRMTIQASTWEDAIATVAEGSALPGHGNMYCVRRRAKPIRCGWLYDCEFDYLGLLSTKRSLVVTDNLEGWDSGTEIQIVAAISEAAAKDNISVGGHPTEYSSMFYVAVGAEPIVLGKVYKVTAALKGISWDKPIKWVPRGYAEKQGMKAAVYPTQATPVPVESNQALVGVTSFWVSIGSVPNCSVSGTQVSPTWSPGVPSNIWSLIPNPVHVYPYGWVIETREPDIIPGTSVCLVKDQYVYYQHFKPGDA